MSEIYKEIPFITIFNIMFPCVRKVKELMISRFVSRKFYTARKDFSGDFDLAWGGSNFCHDVLESISFVNFF